VQYASLGAGLGNGAADQRIAVSWSSLALLRQVHGSASWIWQTYR
jgi:hypothetical protein